MQEINKNQNKILLAQFTSSKMATVPSEEERKKKGERAPTFSIETCFPL